ncbi:MAG: hypothetical protein MSS75_05250 [Megasphaera sp.]|uniref:hypothetical protein n=1 Tax=Megasphaera sp. TaxID=2023260 RepID=UPI0025C44579|nr:hypothetical protein [Megasphaera sp.]MCF0153337.1 hypothetical protein [Megasphaera sp.]MCI7600436.1 hypothetical protein [Megasphaera sp.]
MIEIQFAVIVLLIAMTLVLSRYYNTRFRALEDKMKDVADFQQSVKELAEAVQDLKDAVKAEKTVPAEPEKIEKQELTHPVVPVGQRQPAVVGERSMAVVKETAPQTSQDGVDDEVVAVIMAAVAAYGYPPSAIRSIRPQKRGYKRHRENWAMAARLGGMNR